MSLFWAYKEKKVREQWQLYLPNPRSTNIYASEDKGMVNA